MSDLELSESEISSLCVAARQASSQNLHEGYTATSEGQAKLADKLKAHLISTGTWKGEEEEAA